MYRICNVRNLCPGDIKAVWQRSNFLSGSITHTQIIEELEKEIQYKIGGNKTPIGFQT
ncbi:hypothetical protein P4C99_17535 [Pontiellaceae bacterium B1224]|nr:hypothetical protein [Pontiellaceae bacterium B1224]